MIKGKILLATDFSEAAKKLTETLKDLKNMGFEEVLLVHVVDIYNQGLKTDEVVKKVKNRLRKIKQEIEDEIGMKTIIKVPVGLPADQIYEISNRTDVSMILMAAHGTGYLKQLFLGSTTHNVIRRVRKPVLVEKFEEVNGEYHLVCNRKFKRIMVPVDFSEATGEVLNLVKEICTPVQEIILVSIIEKSSSLEELEARKNEAQEKLARIKNSFEQNNINCTVKVRIGEGIASSNIIRIATEEEAGIIIMSTRGKGRIKNLLLGSTASRVIRHSPIPVLLVPYQFSPARELISD